ncbi:MAG: 2-hydroxyacid dehydrogenase [Chloroflexi bacterium]|nr:2-hydroxyacid dehydrogenase [Chloroflexota bacterium]MDA1297460.1 2-hydroxyacid dehydrogenase [Chloroflexota bacterium]
MSKITAAFLGYRDEWEIERIRSAVPDDVEVVGVPQDPIETVQERGAELALAAEVVVPWRFRVTPELAESPRLRLVQVLSAGTDYLPKKELHEHGVLVAGNNGANSVAVAEIAIMLMVGANRHAQEQIRNLQSGKYHGDFFETWEQYHEITGKRVGIIGLGKIGSKVAKRLQGWDCEVVYHDRLEINPDVETEAHAKRVSLDELLSTSDIISVHVPLTENSRGMIGDGEFAQMKESAIYVSTCRGPVTDEAALIRALENGAIAGAGLDVTEIEPIDQDNPLLKMRNVFMTPHLAGSSIEAREKAVDNAARNIALLSQGKQPQGLIDPFE